MKLLPRKLRYTFLIIFLILAPTALCSYYIYQILRMARIERAFLLIAGNAEADKSLDMKNRIAAGKKELAELTGEELGYDIDMWFDYLCDKHPSFLRKFDQMEKELNRANTDPEWTNSVHEIIVEEHETLVEDHNTLKDDDTKERLLQVQLAKIEKFRKIKDMPAPWEQHDNTLLKSLGLSSYDKQAALSDWSEWIGGLSQEQLERYENKHPEPEDWDLWCNMVYSNLRDNAHNLPWDDYWNQKIAEYQAKYHIGP